MRQSGLSESVVVQLEFAFIPLKVYVYVCVCAVYVLPYHMTCSMSRREYESKICLITEIYIFTKGTL